MKRDPVSIASMVLTCALAGGVERAGAATPVGVCRTLTQPGSYALIRNLAATGDCLVVAADHVTIDLSGFSIQGLHSGGGITDSGLSRRGITVRNGTVTGFDIGIGLGNSQESTVENLRAISNGSGIRVAQFGLLRNNIATSNSLVGIQAGLGATIVENVASNNSIGILADTGSLVSGNTASRNETSGIEADQGSVVTGNAARFNLGTGISVGFGCTVADNTSSGNETGILAVHGTVARNTVFHNSGTGIAVGCPSLVMGNTATGNQRNLDLREFNCNEVHNAVGTDSP
jgi:hypothetical protein